MTEASNKASHMIGHVDVKGRMLGQSNDVIKGALKFAGSLDGKPFPNHEIIPLPFLIEGLKCGGFMRVVAIDDGRQCRHPVGHGSGIVELV